jgi:CheY-like chemotaxis protein
MEDHTKSFGETAVSLARNPLGIIALFIVLVYGLASLVTIFARDFTPAEKTPLIYFQVLFPMLVLAVFYQLVSKHNEKLFGPSDYKNEDNYIKMQMAVVASLAAATAKSGIGASETELNSIVDTVRSTDTKGVATRGAWQRRLLWVDDNPENNTFVRQAFETAGLQVTIALSTQEAFEELSKRKFGVIISDMGRREGKQEGYVLLERLRGGGNHVPLFFYAGSNDPAHKLETQKRGGQGCTNNAQELFELVMKAISEQETA